jgi:hypothetical protein
MGSLRTLEQILPLERYRIRNADPTKSLSPSGDRPVDAFVSTAPGDEASGKLGARPEVTRGANSLALLGVLPPDIVLLCA